MSKFSRKLPENWLDLIREAKDPEELSNIYIQNLKYELKVLENLNKTYKTRLGIYNFETKKRPQSALERIPTSKSKPVQLGLKASDFAKYPTKQKLSQVFVDDAAFGSSATKIEYIRELEQLADALKKQNAEFQNIIKEKELNYQKPSQIAVPQKYEGHDKVGNSILIGKSTLQNVSTIRKQPYEKLKPDNTLQDRQIQNLMEEKKLLEQEIQMYKETKRTRKAKLEGFDLDKLLKRKDKNSIIYETKQKFTQQQKQEEEIKEKYLQALMQETFLLQQQLQKLQEESRHFDPHNVI